MTNKWFDEENNFLGNDGSDNVVLSEMNRLRLLLAGEFLRCKVYGTGGIDSALDDADTALGFLIREGKLFLPDNYAGTTHGLLDYNDPLHNPSPDCRCDYCKDMNTKKDAKK